MSTAIRLRHWPPSRSGGEKRWAVEWEAASQYRREVFTAEADARARYERARLDHERAMVARAKQYVQVALALGGDDGADH